MNWLFNMLNHNPKGQRSLEDVIGIIGHQLRELGHTAVWDKKNDQFLTGEAGINVIVEGFTPPVIEIMAGARARGCRFVILATEEPTEKGFNHGVDPEMVMRQRMFPEAARYCEGIIHLVPGKRVTDWYGQFAPAAYTELGFARTLVRLSPQEPVYDFGFFGSVSRRRMGILNKLAKRSGRKDAVRYIGDFPDQETRDRQIREARVVVQLRKVDAMGLVSSSRCNTALCVGRPVIAEPHELSAPWDQIVSFASSTDHFYNLAVMARMNWQSLWYDQFKRFREMLPADACIGKALRDIGVMR